MRWFSLLWVAGLLACSGAASTDVDSPGVGTADMTTPTVTDGAEPPAGTSSTVDATEPPKTEATPPPAKSDDQAHDCATEEEGNDSLSDATALSSCMGGDLQDGDDDDFVTFDVPADASGLKITHEEKGGRVNYTVFIKALYGAVTIPVAAFTDDTPEIQAFPGTTYYVRMSAPDRKVKARHWQLNVSFE